jgi:predicted ferric reductase
MKWRPWKYLHLLAYPIVFLSFIHVKDLGTFFEFYPALQFVWFAMFMIFIISVLWRLVTWSGVTKAKYVLKSRTLVGDDIVLITLTPTTKLLTSKIGQHFYLQAKSFGSEHPFTIIRNEDGVLSFGIRRVGGFWNEILQKSLGEVVNVDGPYGVFTKEAQNTNPKVIISAGIGVTPFIDLVEDFGENTIYFNCNRSATQIIEREVLKNNSSTYIDILDDATGAAPGEVLSGKITKEVLQNKLEDRVAHLPYFVCGSPGFIKYIQSVLTELGVPKQKIYYEELGF